MFLSKRTQALPQTKSDSTRLIGGVVLIRIRTPPSMSSCISRRAQAEVSKSASRTASPALRTTGRAERIRVEEDKPGLERRSHIHAQLFGQGAEEGIEWAHHPKLLKRMSESRAVTSATAAAAEAVD